MSDSYSLSSEQALDDYFTALLEEEWVEETIAPEPEPEPEPELIVQPVVEKSYLSDSFAEVSEPNAPNLDDVQRLLSQLGASAPVIETEHEPVLAQNTPEVQTAVEPVIEEIQEWDIEDSVADIEAEVKVEAVVPDMSEAEPEIIIEDHTVIETELQTQSGTPSIGHWETPVRDQNFQVLYFDVNGVTFAVPLDELGGIHRKGELNHLIGRPSWYLGLQTNRDSKLDVVDTAKWIMAEKLTDDSYKEAYQYIVMLGESQWGLASSQLLGTETLNTEKIRWRKQVGKRPWLAGMVKDKMCALIHVEALIAMLNAGLDVKALDT